MTWDHRYRRLEEGEIILATDEIQNDDGSWRPAVCVGTPAPNPNYTSHRVYRRLAKTQEPGSDAVERMARASSHSKDAGDRPALTIEITGEMIEAGDTVAGRYIDSEWEYKADALRHMILGKIFSAMLGASKVK